MTALVISGLICLVLAGLLYWRYRNDNNDGDFGIVVPILLLLALGITLLTMALGLHLWRSAWGP